VRTFQITLWFFKYQKFQQLSFRLFFYIVTLLIVFLHHYYLLLLEKIFINNIFFLMNDEKKKLLCKFLKITCKTTTKIFIFLRKNFYKWFFYEYILLLLYILQLICIYIYLNMFQYHKILIRMSCVLPEENGFIDWWGDLVKESCCSRKYRF